MEKGKVCGDVSVSGLFLSRSSLAKMEARLVRFLLLACVCAAMVACAAGVTVTQKVGTVMERKLVKENPTAKGIVNQHKKYSTDQASVKNFENPTLVYVTPWYGHSHFLIQFN